MPVIMAYSPDPGPYRDVPVPQDSYYGGPPAPTYHVPQDQIPPAPAYNYQQLPAAPSYHRGGGRPRLEYLAMVLIVVGTVLIGTGVMVVGTAPGDIDIGEGEYAGGHSSSYRSGYSSGYYDGQDDLENDVYKGSAYNAEWYTGDTLSGYKAGYEDGFRGRSNAMNNLAYHPDIRMGAVGAGSIIVGIGVILEGLGVGFRIKAHFDLVKRSMGL